VRANRTLANSLTQNLPFLLFSYFFVTSQVVSISVSVTTVNLVVRIAGKTHCYIRILYSRRKYIYVVQASVGKRK